MFLLSALSTPLSWLLVKNVPFAKGPGCHISATLLFSLPFLGSRLFCRHLTSCPTHPLSFMLFTLHYKRKALSNSPFPPPSFCILPHFYLLYYFSFPTPSSFPFFSFHTCLITSTRYHNPTRLNTWHMHPFLILLTVPSPRVVEVAAVAAVVAVAVAVAVVVVVVDPLPVYLQSSLSPALAVDIEAMAAHPIPPHPTTRPVPRIPVPSLEVSLAALLL